MPDVTLRLPDNERARDHVLAALQGYWPSSSAKIVELPIASTAAAPLRTPLVLQPVPLPDWAADCGIDGSILVPAEVAGTTPQWREVNWWLAAFLLLECWHERHYEALSGPVHSYSFRLEDWDDRAWQYAWVNRIALFLRRWAARQEDEVEEQLFGCLPRARITMTHDVDAISKTLPIRLKQCSFNLINALRQAARGRFGSALQRLRNALRFLCGKGSWWIFDDLLVMEESAGFRSRFHFYADSRPKGPVRWLFDPGYDVTTEPVRSLIARLNGGGWRTGLHQSFDAWECSQKMSDQRQLLQATSDASVDTCRQHWLRFSWAKTWAAQEDAGFAEDTTLMFNDRMGFRASAALCWNPWNPDTGHSQWLRVLPTVLMDSHAYDYRPMTTEQRRAAFRHWFEELKSVGGHCALLWHPHTLCADYGWIDGYRDCIGLSAELEIELCH